MRGSAHLKGCARRRGPAVRAEGRREVGVVLVPPREGRLLARSLQSFAAAAAAAAAMSREPEIMESQVMWEPDTKRNTHMDRFRAAVASSCGLRLGERRAGAGGEALWALLGALLWL